MSLGISTSQNHTKWIIVNKAGISKSMITLCNIFKTNKNHFLLNIFKNSWSFSGSSRSQKILVHFPVAIECCNKNWDRIGTVRSHGRES